jgi:hypothetical protein
MRSVWICRESAPVIIAILTLGALLRLEMSYMP